MREPDLLDRQPELEMLAAEAGLGGFISVPIKARRDDGWRVDAASRTCRAPTRRDDLDWAQDLGLPDRLSIENRRL